MALTLRSYYRSSCSWRVRIALNWKGLNYKTLPVHLVNNGGEQYGFEMRRKNPMREVPVLSSGQGDLAQSMAILEYLEEVQPKPSLLPTDPFLRARVRQLAEVINSGVQPLQNLRVLKHLGKVHGFSQKDTHDWAKYWIGEGLNAFQELTKETVGQFCVGDQVSFADLLLVPQLYNARRFGVSVNHFPLLLDIEARLSTLSAFQQAHPERQDDAA
ncbi:MAG: maleylacetoacetate isomerase [Myxococcales bacterium]|nr:maleylacetoacetate isomerase [Myxococcales bacterium]|tara:strand:- start:2911 stop:3555 length:645 start_codon:yes stop_codon:yes gene_type:complete